MPWTTWTADMVLYRMGAAAISAEAFAALAFLSLTWLFRPDLIKSRTVIGSMVMFSVVVGVERALTTVGLPLGWVGQAVVAVAGGVVIASAALYHATLSDLPRPEQITEALERVAEAQTEAASARAEAAAAREAAAASARQAFVECMKRLDQNDRQFLIMRRTIGALDG